MLERLVSLASSRETGLNSAWLNLCWMFNQFYFDFALRVETVQEPQLPFPLINSSASLYSLCSSSWQGPGIYGAEQDLRGGVSCLGGLEK